MPVVKVRLVVTDDRAEIRHIGSGHDVSFSQNGAPSGAFEYVYRDVRSRGLKRWSDR